MPIYFPSITYWLLTRFSQYSWTAIYHFILLQLLLQHLQHLRHQLQLIPFYFNLHFPIFKSIPQFPLLPLLHYYHLSPYFLITAPCLTFFLVLWLSLTNLFLPYCTVLQTTPPHLSALHYINHSYFIVVLQFVDCSQLSLHPIQAPSSVYSCDQLWLALLPPTLTTFQLPTSYPLSKIKDTIQVWRCNT